MVCKWFNGASVCVSLKSLVKKWNHTDTYGLLKMNMGTSLGFSWCVLPWFSRTSPQGLMDSQTYQAGTSPHGRADAGLTVTCSVAETDQAVDWQQGWL